MDLVNVGLWDQWPLGDPLPPERWVPCFACGRALWARPGVEGEWLRRAGGHLPPPEVALAEVRRQRARRVLGYRGSNLASAATSFANGVLGALGIPAPSNPAQVPLALARDGFVRRRDAEWVSTAFSLTGADCLHWHGWAYPERGWGFVWAAYRAEVAGSAL